MFDQIESVYIGTHGKTEQEKYSQLRPTWRLWLVLFVLVALIWMFLFTVGCAAHFGESWSKADTKRQIAYTILHVADWIQTHDIVDKGWRELNPLMSDFPSHKEVDIKIGTGLIIQSIIPPLLSPKAREGWQKGWIIVEGAAVVNNIRLGVDFDF